MNSSFHLLWIPAVMLSLSCYAQESTRITGTVRDASTNKPLQNANVYFDNTSIGAATDSTGSFLINEVMVGPDLLISHVGYKTISVSGLKPAASGSVTVDVKMVAEVKTLSPVTFVSKSRDWLVKYWHFKEIFLGKTPNAALTKILNPDVLSFEETNEGIGTIVFRAYASAPLEIENKALGYHLTVSLSEFESVGPSYDIVMNTRFDTLVSSSRLVQKRWKRNRLDAYKGSQLHLFRSIANGIYEQEGFRISGDTAETSTTPRPALVTDLVVDSSRSDLKILRKGIYQVKYLNKILPEKQRTSPNEPFPLSVIRVDDDFLGIYPSGLVKLPANYWRSGYLYHFRVGDLLPLNYNGVREEKILALSDSREFVALHGKVVDEKGEPLSGVEVFVNKGLHHTHTNAWGEFELAGLDPGNYPIAFAYEGKQSALKIINASIEKADPILVELYPEKVVNRRNEAIDLAHRLEYISRIEISIARQSKIPGAAIVKNPSTLQFERSGKSIVFWTTSPLIIENTVLGYRWTYFIDSASFTKSRLFISGLVKMETLDAGTKHMVSRSESKRLDAYEGSWNHVVTSLLEGRTSSEGFHFYRVKRNPGRRRPNFKKLPPANIISVEPDLMITATNGQLFLRAEPDLEVHNDNKRYSHKFYKGLWSQVLRFESDSTFVKITKTGVADPESFHISGLPNPFLPSVPVDYHPQNDKGVNPDVLVYVREENLKAVKNLMEKVYLQTDRPYYYPGDTIWFKAYLRYSNLKYRDSLSTVLYVDLMSPSGDVLATAVTRIKDGQSWGDIPVASNVVPGDLYLRAYTNWMRNFSEFMIDPLPILSHGNFIAPGVVDTTMHNNNELLITLSADKSRYGKRDPVKLDIHTLKDGRPMDGTFSVSVTDQSIAADIEGRANILSLNDPFKSTGAAMIRLAYPLERGIVLHGKIDQANQKSEYVVTTVLANGNSSTITPVRGRDFSITLDFADTSTAIIQCMSKQGALSTVEIAAHETVRSYHLPEPLTYRLSTSNFQSDRGGSVQGPDVRILQEVIVGASLIPKPTQKVVTRTQATFGQTFKIFQGKDVEAVRNSGNLLNYLSIRLPEFYHTLNLITSGIALGTLETSGANTATTSRNKIYSFYLNGLPLSLMDLELIQTSIVSRIEVYWAPGATRNIVAIYTEPNFAHETPNFNRYLLRGYDRPNIFHVPSEKSLEPDYRAALYWNPNVKTGLDGKTSLLFHTSDVDGTYKITIEGVTSDGEFFRATKYLDILK